jgi:APA family basic amino acid/polyamine antiporter
MKSGLLRTKPMNRIMGDTEVEGPRLRRALTAWDLTAIGIGCIIGVGIFVLPGVEAAIHAGPGIILSFAIASIACACSALCYAELAAMIPVSGSAYTYGYATLGEIFGWIIGWDLILEYMVAAILVATGWSAYFVNLLRSGFGLDLPRLITASPFEKDPGLLNLPAVAIVLVITWLLARGIKESSRVNLTIVIVKLAVVLFFIVIAVGHVDPAKWQPFLPFGLKGVVTAAAIVFLAYVGFDAVSTTAEEAKNPQRDLPIGIMASLIVATVLYMAVAAIMTGVVPYQELGVADPIALVLNTLKMPWASALVSVGAIAGITSVLLVLIMVDGRRCRCRRGPDADQRFGRAVFDRDAVRLHHRRRRGHRPQVHSARHPPGLQGAPQPLLAGPGHRSVRPLDAQTPPRDLVPVPGLAAGGIGHLL